MKGRSERVTTAMVSPNVSSRARTRAGMAAARAGRGPASEACEDGGVIEQLRLPVAFETRRGPVTIRRATVEDLDAVVALIHEDPISAARDDRSGPDDAQAYRRALSQIVEDPRNELIIAADSADAVVGTLQLTSIPGLARRGSTRLQVEAVRVAPHARSSGIGGALMRWVTETAAPAVGAALVQLTSDSARADARRFYLRSGFVDSHVGFKYRVAR